MEIVSPIARSDYWWQLGFIKRWLIIFMVNWTFTYHSFSSHLFSLSIHSSPLIFHINHVFPMLKKCNSWEGWVVYNLKLINIEASSSVFPCLFPSNLFAYMILVLVPPNECHASFLSKFKILRHTSLGRVCVPSTRFYKCN